MEFGTKRGRAMLVLCDHTGLLPEKTTQGYEQILVFTDHVSCSWNKYTCKRWVGGAPIHKLPLNNFLKISSKKS